VKANKNSINNRMRIQNIFIITLALSLLGCKDEVPAQQPGVQQQSAPQASAPTSEPRIEKTDLSKVAALAPVQPAQSTSAASATQPAASTTAESGTALKADDIKAEPFRDAITLASVALGDKLEILQRDGGWLQVNSNKGKGWVRMLSVRLGDASKSSASTGVLGLASGRAGTGKVVSTTGIRGLSEEELKSASFNEAEVTLDESYASSKSDAAAFAAQAKLVARPFNYLAAPK